MKKERIFRCPVTIQLDEHDYNFIREDAFKAGMSTSAFMREIARTYIAEAQELDDELSNQDN